MNSQNNLIFCTLFDSNYLDKGLALYHSMERHMQNFKLYVFAFDDKCFEVLSDMNLKHAVLVPSEKIMDDRLLKIKTERTQAEFCWTCTPIVIEYVLCRCQEKVCTYIDADIFFFANPDMDIQKIIDHGCSVGIVPHRFERTHANIEEIFTHGKYCVQFNTFFNDKDGLQVLNDWKENCLKWCYRRYENGKFGDQKYVDTWKMKYTCVYESENPGVGVAPWNLHLYTYEGIKSREIWLSYREKSFPVIFYHFEGMRYLNNEKIFLNLWECGTLGTHRKMKKIYGAYFNELQSVRSRLESQYGISFEHMEKDSDEFKKEGYSLSSFCRSRGFLSGVKEWISFQTNNLIGQKEAANFSCG